MVGGKDGPEKFLLVRNRKCQAAVENSFGTEDQIPHLFFLLIKIPHVTGGR